MNEILRTRVIRPSTRKTSSSYKISTTAVGLNDSLRVEITHESMPGQWVFTFAGRDIGNRDSIYFSTSETNGKVIIQWRNIEPRNGALKASVSSASIFKGVKPVLIANAEEAKRGIQKTSFPPVIGEGCSILILGTMPGDESLKLQQYYAHPRNRFWKVMAGIIGRQQPNDYNERIRWLVDNRVALWDVAHQCERAGSLDINIRNEEPNDLHGLLKQYPTIRAIAFNGKTAEELFSRFFGNKILVTRYNLPSTSPANTVTMDYIVNKWSVIKGYIKGA